MKNTLSKYLPLVPVLVGYFLLFLAGENMEGTWQLIAMLAFIAPSERRSTSSWG